ncbi:hypothetical protein K435DRAFT_866151, partial [Dendrothele bispora CBS 962.96]
MSGLRTTLRILRDAPTNTSPSSSILQVASANRLIVGCCTGWFSSLYQVLRRRVMLKSDFLSSLSPGGCHRKYRISFRTSSLLFQLLEPTTTTTRLHTRASLRDCTFFELSSLDPEMQPSATSPYVVVYFGQNPALFATLSQTARSKISLSTPTTTYNFNDYLAVLGKQSVFEMAHYKSTAQNPFGGLQAFLNDHRVLFSPSTLKTYFREDLISLATRVKDIFGLVDAWTVNIDNELPLVIDRARLTVFRNLRDAYDPSIFDEDAELRSWVSEGGRKGFEPATISGLTINIASNSLTLYTMSSTSNTQNTTDWSAANQEPWIEQATVLITVLRMCEKQDSKNRRNQAIALADHLSSNVPFDAFKACPPSVAKYEEGFKALEAAIGRGDIGIINSFNGIDHFYRRLTAPPATVVPKGKGTKSKKVIKSSAIVQDDDEEEVQ